MVPTRPSPFFKNFGAPFFGQSFSPPWAPTPCPPARPPCPPSPCQPFRAAPSSMPGLSLFFGPLAFLKMAKMSMFSNGSSSSGGCIQPVGGCGCATSKPPCSNGCCEVRPSACQPQLVAEIVTCVCPGQVARIPIGLTNNGDKPRIFRVDMHTIADEKLEVVTPAEVSVAPFDREQATAEISILPTAQVGTMLHRVILVRSCTMHVIRWTLHVSSAATDPCQCVEIADCGPRIHHWYDHFQCTPL